MPGAAAPVVPGSPKPLVDETVELPTRFEVLELEEDWLLEVAGVVGPLNVILTEVVPGCTTDVNEVVVVVPAPPAPDPPPELLPPPPPPEVQ